MWIMILKMTAVTALYVVLTVLLWKSLQRRTMTAWLRVAVGVIYGGCAVLSTHFGVDYSHMMLNVRDLGPLSAGLFFDPVSGVIAGLIGGVERYVAGTYWGVGSYTRIACSVSTCLAGFLAAAVHVLIFKRRKPAAIYAFFMGAVMEVFHMYVVFITHRDDMSMAFYVVKTCAPPMIVFTGLGMAASAAALELCAGEWRNPFRRVSAEEIPVSRRFQLWLFGVALAVLALNLAFSFAVQTQTAVQGGRETLAAVSQDIRQTYEKLAQTGDNAVQLAGETARMEAQAVSEAVRRSGGVASAAADRAYLEQMRSIFGLVAVSAVDERGMTVASAGDPSVFSAPPDAAKLAIGEAPSAGGTIRVAVDVEALAAALNLSGLNEALSYFHVGSEGGFEVFRADGAITAGDRRGLTLPAENLARVAAETPETSFRATVFGTDSLCRTEALGDGLTLLAHLPMSEVYADRDAQTYETALADIILFAVIYVLISMLVQGIVVNNLELVNASLDRITNGNLDEVVSVRNSSEFASLSNDINQTVTVLKGYIDAAEKRIEEELEFARTIQHSALPNNFTFPRSDFSLYATMDPAKEVGGDFYDFFFVDQHKLALVIADVSGKGIPAALFMMRAKTAIRGLAEAGRSPAEILSRANETLCEGNEAEMFVTVWLGIIDLRTGKMTCANAGHEYPTLMRAGGDYELLRDRHGFVLAAMETARYKEYELDFAPGDRLFVYTDGIPEAIDEQTAQYGTDRLLRVLNTVRDVPMDAALPAVRADIAAFVGAADQFDDITMLGFVYNGPAGDALSQ